MINRVILAEAWNGSTWAVEATPSPPGASHGVLSDVSCTPANCTAVGSFSNTAGITVPLAERHR